MASSPFVVSRKYVVQRLSTNFRESVEIVTCNVPKPGPTDIIVKNRFIGINAKDINISAGRNTDESPPFDIGFEAVGEIVAVGNQGRTYEVGQSVGYMCRGAYAQYLMIPEQAVFVCPSLRPEYVALLVSGLTAFISLDKAGDMKSGETVLVTAAAGGTGHLAVQIAKHAGCHVIGTCSTEKKAAFLKRLGCDRVVIHTRENLADVLRNEYHRGVDLVYDGVGGELYDTCLRNLAVRGRLIIIGYVSGYQSKKGILPSDWSELPTTLKYKSARVQGFILPHYRQFWGDYFKKLLNLFQESRIIATTDNGCGHVTGPFKGLESIQDAVEFIYTKRSIGKVYVDMDDGEDKTQ